MCEAYVYLSVNFHAQHWKGRKTVLMDGNNVSKSSVSLVCVQWMVVRCGRYDRSGEGWVDRINRSNYWRGGIGCTMVFSVTTHIQ